MKFSKNLIAVVGLAVAMAPAMAEVVSLNFEGINATYPSTNYAQVLNFYNGGTSSQGTTGSNYGISFSSNALAICLNALGDSATTCSNTSRGGFAPGSDKGGLFFLTGSETYMNVAAGFTTGFSFNYASKSLGGDVKVYDGANGTGNILSTLNLLPNAGICPDYAATVCPFSASGVLFSGTALSIGFGGAANYIVFDDVTFGSATPGPAVPAVPEPSTYALMALGMAGIGVFARRRKSA